MNAVIKAIESGHVASFDGDNRYDPNKCKKCEQPWPCVIINAARQDVRRLHGVKRAS